VKPTALGAYIFAGGFTLGVREHFKVLAHFEDGPFGVKTAERNLGLPVFQDPATWPADNYKSVDFLYANPPCAPFSVAGHSPLHKRGLEAKWYERDPRTSCIYATFSLLERIRPTVWAWESVIPAWSKGRDLVDGLTARARKLGYGAYYVFLSVQDLGLPQRRKRFFCVFSKVAIPFAYARRDPAAYVTVGQAWEGAFGDPAGTRDGYQSPSSEQARQLLKTCPPGMALRRHWEALNPESKRTIGKRGQVVGRPAFNRQRLTLEASSPTILGGAHLYHPLEDRVLTVPEQQVLCGYPPDYAFIPSTPGRPDLYAQIAKAVTPPAGRWLARNVRKGVEAAVPTDRHARVVDFIKDVFEEV